MLLLLLMLGSTWGQEYTTPSNLLGPRDFNHHPYEGQYLKEINPPEPTKKGPVLFPNDAPPPPKPPLIVTARPLAEAIKRSELTPDNATRTNSIAESENRVYEKQGFSNRADYFVTPLPVYNDPVTGKAIFADLDYNYDYKNPYQGVLKKSRGNGRDNRYDEYEEQAVLPPIYKALSDHAKQKVLKIQQSKNVKRYQVKEPDYGDSYPNNKLDKDEDDLSDDQNSNYAFSYTVRDKHTGDDFSHKQQSSGSATNGEYRVRLPDGRTQIVSYTADENGYKADVRYDDETGNRIDNDQSLKIDEHKYEHKHEHKHELNKYKHTPQIYEQVKKIHEYNYKPIENRNYEQTAQVYEPVARIREYHPKIADIPYKAPIQNQVDYKVAHNERIDEYNQRIEDQNIGNQNFGYNSNPNQDYNYENYKTNGVNYKNDYKVNEDYSYDTLKDYGDEYSAELEGKQYEYQPHESKFTQYAPTPEPNKNIGVIIVPNENSVSSTVRPSLQSLRNLFLNKVPLNSRIPVQLNVPSTTQSPDHYDSDENVVIIGTPKPKLYTKTEVSTQQPNYQTPSSYLESTIASLRNRNVDFSGAKPVLSGSFIDRINKYLSF